MLRKSVLFALAILVLGIFAPRLFIKDRVDVSVGSDCLPPAAEAFLISDNPIENIFVKLTGGWQILSQDIAGNVTVRKYIIFGIPIRDVFVEEEEECYSQAFSGPTSEHQDRVNFLSLQEYESGDEVLTAYIKNVYEKEGKIFIDADEFKWYGYGDGESDTCVYPSDFPSGEIPADETRPECGPNPYAIVNDNEQTKTFELSPDAKVRLMEEFGNMPDLNTLSPREFMNGTNKWGQKFYVSYFDGDYGKPYFRPFQLIFKEGKLIFIHQIYVP